MVDKQELQDLIAKQRASLVGDYAKALHAGDMAQAVSVGLQMGYDASRITRDAKNVAQAAELKALAGKSKSLAAKARKAQKDVDDAEVALGELRAVAKQAEQEAADAASAEKVMNDIKARNADLF